MQPRRFWYAFRFDIGPCADDSHIARMPGQLFAFASRLERDAWVAAGPCGAGYRGLAEDRRGVSPLRLPAGWREQEAIIWNPVLEVYEDAWEQGEDRWHRRDLGWLELGHAEIVRRREEARAAIEWLYDGIGASPSVT